LFDNLKLNFLLPLQTLAQVATPPVLANVIIPTVLQLSNDPIPNIRFNVAKSIEILSPALKNPDLVSLVNDQIKPTLTRLHDDSDVDVKYFSARAIAACGWSGRYGIEPLGFI